MKYRGPKDQFRKIEKRYLSGILVGIIIIGLGVGGNIAFNAGLSTTTVEVQRGVGEEPEVLEVTLDRSNSLGIASLGAGGIVNLYSINKYRKDYAEIREAEPRPSGPFIGLGLVITVAALSLGWVLLFSI